MLMARIARQVKDKKILLLVRRFLQAGVMEDGLVKPTEEGTPQGGPLSPLLSLWCTSCPARGSAG